jgi:hypothetical protein
LRRVGDAVQEELVAEDLILRLTMRPSNAQVDVTVTSKEDGRSHIDLNSGLRDQFAHPLADSRSISRSADRRAPV